MAERATKTIDEQFHDVAIAIAESRDFTNFCFTRLESSLTASLESRIVRLEQAMEGRFAGIDGRLAGIDGRFTRLEERMEGRFTRQDLILTEILNEVKKP